MSYNVRIEFWSGGSISVIKPIADIEEAKKMGADMIFHAYKDSQAKLIDAETSKVLGVFTLPDGWKMEDESNDG